MDINMVRQGQPGYTNEEVRTGDLILKIDGRDVRNVSSHALQILLKGKKPERSRLLVSCAWRTIDMQIAPQQILT